MVIGVWKHLAISVEETTEDEVELELLLVSSPGQPEFLAGMSMFHDVLELRRELALCPCPNAGHAKVALLHILV